MGEPDFVGWATVNDVKCSDGRTIRSGAFKHQDEQTVPLVWQHQHDVPENILGHAVLKHKEQGVLAYAYFNDTPSGRHAKAMVAHKDIKALSIYANQLRQQGGDVLHGDIKEVSLVLAGANPGALIDELSIRHSDEGDILEAVIYTDDNHQMIDLVHEDKTESSGGDVATSPSKTEGKTVKDVYDSLTEEQKNVVHFMIGEALADADGDDDDDDLEQSGLEDDSTDSTDSNDEEYEIYEPIVHKEDGVSRNVFDQSGTSSSNSGAQKTLSHSQLETIKADAERLGSLKRAILIHATTYGIDNIDVLFPDAQAIEQRPELVGRRLEWVDGVLNGTRKLPFSRIKSVTADVNHDEARAKGYIKGAYKKDEWFALQQRTTSPTTVYKKQKLDRDDIIDITNLDVVAWLKAEMRMMLNEEIARAILIGDGRDVASEDKIKDPGGAQDGVGIRSIAHDHEFYTHKITVATNSPADSIVEAVMRNRKNYRGSGQPTLYCTEDLITDMLMLKDRMGRFQYETIEALRIKLRVAAIVTVDALEDHLVLDDLLLGVLVNLNDYSVGTEQGGQVSMFDDFDIDYNQFKYLMEARMSGALTKFKSAQVIVREGGGTEVIPTEPTFNATTGVVTIPTVTGVEYLNAETGVALVGGVQPALAAGSTLYVEANPTVGYYFPFNTQRSWSYTRPVA